jgi:hypothetical protein
MSSKSRRYICALDVCVLLYILQTDKDINLQFQQRVETLRPWVQSLLGP